VGGSMKISAKKRKMTCGRRKSGQKKIEEGICWGGLEGKGRSRDTRFVEGGGEGRW